MGIRYLLRSTGAEQVIIGIEANKQDAADHLSGMICQTIARFGTSGSGEIPARGGKNADHGLLGREVPSGGLPIDVGALWSM
jgi:electron transport complex protein RnfC